ncbi:MAG TPA: phage/plasmid primase, P4 family [Vicinamibacterales bacterium]|nr:phage/plasmid primase, P4 family [Vicinamibacterales bacterium]
MALRLQAAEAIFGTDATSDPLTEVGAAERFARLHGDDVRFDHRRQRWLLWAGHRWTPDSDAAIHRIAIEFARQWQHEALDVSDRDRREKVVTFAMRLERRDGLTNMLALARVLKPIADKGEDWDADPWLLGVPNGVIDLRTGTLRDGRREDQITMSGAVPFDATARCDRWERFVVEVFMDPDLVSFVHRAAGYSLTGATAEQVLFLLYGVGSNGKGTFTNTLKFILGDHSWNMPFATLEMRASGGIPNDLAALVSRRFVVASETNDGARLNEARVKALTGCDPVTARFLHGEFFEFEPVAKFWLSVNHKPVIRDDSFGFWRRLRLLPFTQRFDVNPALADELRAEAAGILAWAVRGCTAWQREGLQPPDIVRDATREYEQDSDPLAGFLAEACEVAPLAEVGASDIFEHYRHWAESHGLTERERMSSTKFGTKFAERFEREHRRSGKVYTGVARRAL